MTILLIDGTQVDLKPLKGNMPKTFQESVTQLTRPYYPLEKVEYDKVFANGANYFMLNQEVVTFGNADNGWALMPLQCKYAKRILNKNLSTGDSK